MKETSKLLDVLVEREKELKKELGEIGKQIKAERDRIAFDRYDVTVGSVVLSKGHKYLVTDVDSHWEGKPWLKAKKKLKNGKFGSLSRWIYGNWEAGPSTQEKKPLLK